jgi:hypothetical protein
VFEGNKLVVTGTQEDRPVEVLLEPVTAAGPVSLLLASVVGNIAPSFKCDELVTVYRDDPGGVVLVSH